MKKASLLLLVILTIASGLSAQNETQEKATFVEIVTDSGVIEILLYKETPLHRENFIKLIKSGYYDGQVFHRLIKNFMIQGGDPNTKDAVKGELYGQGGPGYSIPAEILDKYFHKKGALAAARKGDDVNPSRASSGSQFYIVQGVVFTKPQLELMVERKLHKPFTEEEEKYYTTTGGSPHLDGAYTVFGEVSRGLDVLEKLMNIPTDSYDRPVTDIPFSINILD